MLFIVFVVKKESIMLSNNGLHGCQGTDMRDETNILKACIAELSELTYSR